MIRLSAVRVVTDTRRNPWAMVVHDGREIIASELGFRFGDTVMTGVREQGEGCVRLHDWVRVPVRRYAQKHG